ncbi:MAG: adenylate cyclase [Paracoccaceae bacterium]|jgi:adenylate cyclase
MTLSRLELAQKTEGLRRLFRISIARSAAMVAIGGIVMVVAPVEVWPYFLSICALFIATGWGNYWLAHNNIGVSWRDYIASALDFAMLAFTLIYPPPAAPIDLHPAFYLRFDSFDFFYVILASLAISLRPVLLIWGGICGVFFWSLGLWWLIAATGANYTSVEGVLGQAEIITQMADPSFVHLETEFQGMVIFLIVSILLATAVEASQRLFLRQVNQERRAANLSRYLPTESVEALATRDEPFSVEAETHAAILFADVVGFSGLAEKYTPREVIELLRGVHSVLAEQVFAHHGTLDKFIGDGVMSTFGAVTKSKTDAANAVACAGEILSAIAEFNRGRASAPVIISVGVHYGVVVVGDVGSARRMELAVIGDAVNVASRMETATRALGIGAAISEEAMIAAGWPEAPQLIGPQMVKGRVEPVVVWGLPRV